MGNDQLDKIMNNPNISFEQKQAIIDAIKNNKNTNTTMKSVYKTDDNSKIETFETKNIVRVNRPDLDNQFIYKNIPCEGNIFKVFYLANSTTLLNKNSNLLGAFIIKWINEQKIFYKYQKGSLFKKDCHIIELNKSLRFDDPYENEIYSFIRRAAKDNILTDKEFKVFCEKKKFELQHLIDEINAEQEKHLEENNLLTKKVNTQEKKIQDEANPLNVEGITLTSTHTDITYNKKIEKDIKEIVGFKNYIKSLHTDTKTDLPNDYYVFSELLGISNFIAHKFNEVYPEFYFRHYQFLSKLRTDFTGGSTVKDKFAELSKMQIK